MPTTQYVWITQTATFTCATNHKCTLKFSSSNDVSLIQQEDQQARATTASFIVTADNNGTSVSCTCTAYSGSTPLHTSPVHGYAQGMVLSYTVLYSTAVVTIACTTCQSFLTRLFNHGKLLQ